DDIDPNDRDVSGRVFGSTGTSIYKKRREASDFAAAEMIRSRIWGDADTEAQDGQAEVLPMIPDSFDVSSFSVGTVVSHTKYGEGTITEVKEQRNGDVEIHVAFPEAKSKIFMASLAPPLTIIS